MATLPEPYVPDVMQGIRAHQAGYAFGREQQQNALAQRAGGMAAGGDFGGAANALLQGGDLQGGFGIQDRVRAMAKEANDQDLAKSARAHDLFFRLATVADTPEKWQTAIGHLRSMGADTAGFDDFGSRDMAMARFGQTKDVLGTVLEERKARAISGALLPQQQAANPAMADRRPSVANAMQQGASQGQGSIVDRIEGNESGGNPPATNPRSSATGSGQFIDSTWLATLKRARPDIAQGRSDAELLAMRSNRNLSRDMIGAYAAENGRALQGAGFEPTDANTDLAHFAGPAGAVAVLRANPATPVERVLGRRVVEANPFLAGMSAGDLVSWAGRKMGGQAQTQQNALAPQPQGAPARLNYDAGVREALKQGDVQTALALNDRLTPKPTEFKTFKADEGIYQAVPSGLNVVREPGQKEEDKSKKVSAAAELRKEFNAQSKDFQTQLAGADRVNVGAKSDNGPGDIAIVYGFMKMLDPTSVVREGEFATAEQAGGVPEHIIARYNQLVAGDRLSPKVRAEFVSQAGVQLNAARRRQNALAKRYTDIATRNGLDPSDVTTEFAQPPSASAGTTDGGAAPRLGANDKAAYDALPSGAVFIDPDGNERIKP